MSDGLRVWPLASVLDEGRRIGTLAEASGVRARLLGGCGMALHAHREIPVPPRRTYGDLDYLGRQPAERPVVGILGSARITPDDPRYTAGVLVGRRLAESGFSVMTGGYGGSMEAVSRGAAEAGGEVIGLPIRRWRNLEPNRWITRRIWVDSFVGRLPVLASCVALVALDGGIGTLAEVAVTWADRQTDPTVTPPLILVGPAWRAILDAVENHLVIGPRDLALARWIAGPEEVAPAVFDALGASTPDGGPRG